MISIRKATVDDLNEIMEINLACFSTPYNEELLTKAMENDAVIMYVATNQEDEIIAYCECIYLMVEMEISSLAVKKEYRRKGVASLMIDTVMSSMSKMGVQDVFLEVRSKNTPAKELYANSGFKKIATRKGYYKKPLDDAYVMHHRIADEGISC